MRPVDIEKDVHYWGLSGRTLQAMNHVTISYRYEDMRGRYFVFKIREEYAYLLSVSIFNRILKLVRQYYCEIIPIDVVITHSKKKRYVYPKKSKEIEEDASNDIFDEIDMAISKLGY